MAGSVGKALYAIVLVVLVAMLVLVIWQPVLPSGWIIQGMARQIDPGSLPAERAAVLRFELAGKGGGNYNLLLSRESVEFTEGDVDRVDLLIATRATDFNRLVFELAQGKADESTFARLMISNTLKMAGDMTVLELLNPTGEGE